MLLTINNMQVFVTVCSSIGLILNISMATVICICSGSGIGNYKYLLFAYTTVAIGSCAIEIALLPMFHPTAAGWLYFSTVDRFSPSFGNILILVYCASFAILLQILTLSFFYRYVVICRPPSMEFWRKPSTNIAVLLFMFLCTVFCGSQTYAVFPTTYTIRELDGVVHSSTSLHLRNLAHIGGYLYRDGTWWTTGTFAVISYIVVMVANMIVIVYCLIKVLVFFHQSAELQMPASIRAVQKRFVLLLLLQTLVPVIFTFSPVLISYMSTVLSINLPLEAHIFYSCFQPIAQLLEPIIIISLLKEYRIALKRVLRLKVTSS